MISAHADTLCELVCALGGAAPPARHLGEICRAPPAARPSVGTARHRGRLAWDDPLLIDRPVLPFGSFNLSPVGAELRRVSPFSDWSGRQAGSTSSECSERPHPLGREASIRLAHCEASPAVPVLPRRPLDSTHIGVLSSPAPALPWPPSTAALRWRSARADHSSCGSSPGSSCNLAPFGLGRGRPPGLRPLSSPGSTRWARSSCDPVCHHYVPDKTPGQGVFLSSQGYPLRKLAIPRTIPFIHRQPTGCTQNGRCSSSVRCPDAGSG